MKTYSIKIKKITFSAILLLNLAFLQNVFCITKTNQTNLIEAYTFDNGIQFYYIENTSNQIDSIAITVEGNTLYTDSSKAGIEQILFELISKSSDSYDMNFIEKYKYETGTNFQVYSTPFYTSFMMECIDDKLEEALPVFLSCFVNPELDQNEFQKIKTVHFQEFSKKMNKPLEQMQFYADNFLNKDISLTNNTPTAESLLNITYRDIISHYVSILDSRRIKIFVISSQPVNYLIKECTKYMGTVLPAQHHLLNIQDFLTYTNNQPIKNRIVLSHEDTPQNGYLARYFKLPSETSDEYLTLQLALPIYKEILNNILGTKYEVCYDTKVFSTGDFQKFGCEIFNNCSDLSNLKQYIKEAQDILLNGQYVSSVDEEGVFSFDSIESILEGTKNSFITSQYSNSTTTSDQLKQIINNTYIYNSTDYQTNLLSKIRNITADQIITVFKKYFLLDENGDNFWISIVPPEKEEFMETFLEKF